MLNTLLSNVDRNTVTWQDRYIYIYRYTDMQMYRYTDMQIYTDIQNTDRNTP